MSAIGYQPSAVAFRTLLKAESCYMPDRYYIGGSRPYGRPPDRRPAASGRTSPKWLRTAGWVLLGIVIVAVVAGIAVYLALKHVPEFYQQAMVAGAEELTSANREMQRQVAGLVSDVKREGRWQAVFTAEQINGYLAVGLAKQRPDMLPANLSNPRVSISKDGVKIAAKFRTAAVDTVVSLDVDVYPAGPNVVALRVQRIRAGSFPLPLGRILSEVAQATNRLEWEVRWGEESGDPVAMITIPPPRNPGEKVVTIETIELDEGVIRVAGTSRGP